MTAATAPIEPAIVANGLTRTFDDLTAVQDITFDVPPGSIVGIIGPSGSGKTTTLRMLMGSLRPSGGEVRVLGEEPFRFRRGTREQIGYMPQQFILYPDLTAKENVDFVASLYGLLLFRRRARTNRVLKVVDLWDARSRKAKDLSGGMQRRLELAAALVHEPRLLVLDEPTAGVDPILRRSIWDELQKRRDGGTTILVTTQYVTEAEECDQVALIAEGRLVALDTPDELRRRAYGGDVIEFTTESTFDAGTLQSNERVRAIRQTGLREFQVVVDDGGQALPELVDAIGRAGGEVAAAREARASFEDVFAELVERARAGGDADAPSDVEPHVEAAPSDAPLEAVEVPPEPGPDRPPEPQAPPSEPVDPDDPNVPPPAPQPDPDPAATPPMRAPGDLDAPDVQRAPGPDDERMVDRP